MHENSPEPDGLRRLIYSILRSLPQTPFFDRIYATAVFWIAHRRWPNRRSMLVNDYLHRMKTSGEIDDVLRQYVSDKEFAKYFINYQLGYDATPKTHAVFNRPDELQTEGLKVRCVLKPTHLSGQVVYFDPEQGLSDEQRRTVMKCFEMSWYREGRERNYKNLRRRVIAEEAVGERETIKDYKVYCVQGVPKLVQVDRARHTEHSRVIYTTDWTPLDLTFSGVPLGDVEPPPRSLPKILDYSTRLSRFSEFLRVDFYVTPERLYVGELTNCPNSALNIFPTIDQEREFSGYLFGG